MHFRKVSLRMRTLGWPITLDTYVSQAGNQSWGITFKLGLEIEQYVLWLLAGKRAASGCQEICCHGLDTNSQGGPVKESMEYKGQSLGPSHRVSQH